MVGIKNKIQKRKYDRSRKRKRKSLKTKSNGTLSLEVLDQITTNNVVGVVSGN